MVSIISAYKAGFHSPKWATEKWWLAKIWGYPKKRVRIAEIQDCNLIYPFEKYRFLIVKKHYGFLIFLLGTYRSEFGVVFASALVHAETHECVVALEPGDGVADHVHKGRLMHRVSKNKLEKKSPQTRVFLAF
jgi:hypothetical protein